MFHSSASAPQTAVAFHSRRSRIRLGKGSGCSSGSPTIRRTLGGDCVRCGAWRATARYTVAAARAEWRPRRSRDPRAPRGWNNCPRPPATNQSGRSEPIQELKVDQIPHARHLPIAQAPPARHLRSAPSSCGSMCQGMPLRRTKTMPVRQARSETRGRPPCGRRGGIGKNGSTRSHNGSGSRAAAIAAHATSPKRIRFEKFRYRL